MRQAGHRKAWLVGAAGAALALAGAQAHAQDAVVTAPQAAQSEAPRSAEEIVVTAEIAYRNRVEGAAPVLDYGLDYFQRFEPLTVGDMLKRTPSVGFVSDVLEFDGARLRGLDPGYAQVLINGERVPGSGVDRSFFVDRIPAELVERIEIIRSPSANRSGDQVAGALNIVLRESHTFEGAFARAGALHFDDGEIKPVFGGLIAGPLGEGRALAGFNIQGRHNPKEKRSLRFSPEGDILEFDNREDQSDVRDGTDYSFNADLTYPIGAGEIELSGFYVLTNRTETENSVEFGDPTAFDNDLVETVLPQFEDIRQENYSLEAELRQRMLGGEVEIEVGFARFQDDIIATESETAYDGEFPDVFIEFGSERQFTDVVDEEWTFEGRQTWEFGKTEFEIGVDLAEKTRETEILSAESELAEEDGPFPAATPIPPFEEAEPAAGGLSTIEERRLDPYVMLSGDDGFFEWEIGVRYEFTEISIDAFADIDDDGVNDFGGVSRDYSFWLPSAHLRVNLTEDDRLTFSGGRAVRRPNFDSLSPARFFEEPTEDFALTGNPQLNPESSWGFDIGYERRIARSGVAGVNVFFRNVTDLIELVNTGETWSPEPAEDDPLPLLAPANIGDGQVWGVEFDLSAPLTLFGLEDTGVFLNYSYLDSEVTDPVTGQLRRFNNQADYVLNVGFIQDLAAWDAAFGATYREQGDAFARILGETVETSYGGDLEVFVEKRFAERLVVRFTASNLLDATKDEIFFKWNTREDQLSGLKSALDEFEVETESAGPVYQIVGRLAF
jgi:outer membrane receptor protein involved in Fe transport